MANFYRIVFFLFLFFPSIVFSQPAPVGSIDLAGYVKSSDGTYSRVTGGDTDTRTASNNNGTVTSSSRALVQTSKGAQSFDIVRSSSVDVSRIGKSVAKFAIASGPVGMAVGVASLVCELSSICNDAGQWMMRQIDLGGTSAGHYPSCQEAIGIAAGSNWQDCTTINKVYPGALWFRSPKVPPTSANCINRGGTAWTYTAFAYTCSSAPVNEVPATETDIDNASSKLNDPRFVPELLEKGQDVPTGVPTLTPDQKKRLGLESVPTKDSSGNTTGREETTTDIEALDGATSDNPSRVIIKETRTTIKYDTNNTQISSTTNTSYSSQPDNKQQSFEIKFDEVPPAALTTHEVPNTFASTSWGSGSCPPDVQVNTKNVDFAIPTQPICDTAIMVNPFILMLSTLIGIYIVAGVRGGANPS